MSKTIEQHRESVYTAAVAFKEADDDPSTGKWALSARWADYTKALHEHAMFHVEEFKKNRETQA